MMTIIAGSRSITKYQDVLDAIATCPWRITSVVSGMARGVDSLGEKYAEDNHLPLHRFPADWYRYGPAAGPMRNRQMAKASQALIAVWDGKSRGTANMIGLAQKHGLLIHVYEVPPA